MKTPSIRRLALTAFFVIHPSSFILAQGPLTPPGAPAATMRTLDQLDAKLEKRTAITVLPVNIAVSGSYYLAGSLTAPLLGLGISINASNVTLDLNGFELIGNTGTNVSGVIIGAGRSNVVIRNGTVRNWTGRGIVVADPAVSGVRVEGVRAIGNGNDGIAPGIGCVVVDCLASGNAANGISTGDDSQVLRCTSRGNTAGGDGIQVGSRCTVRECVATGNSGRGIEAGDASEIGSCRVSANTLQGFRCFNGCAFRDCTADGNGDLGFQCGTDVSATGCTATNNLGGFFFNNNARVTQCTASSNTGNGINTFTGATMQGCMAALNTGIGIVGGVGTVVADSAAVSNSGASGIAVGNHSTVSGCTLNGNTSGAATSQGISGGFNTIVIRCSVGNTLSTAAPTGSTGAGISVTSGSTVQDCRVSASKGDGIRVTSDCRAYGNACDGSGGVTGDGAGIHVTSIRNRIDSNHVTNGDRGIEVDFTANTIVRNTAVNNPVNYDIVAGNSIGAIVLPANSVLINTNVAQASSLGSTDPWANFSE